MAGLTFDAGALIGLERRDVRITKIFRLATEQRVRITAPATAIVEWWRGHSWISKLILDSIDIEPVDEVLARLAGDAIAAVQGATSLDAVVMASAARRGDVVYTSDVADLLRLQAFFPGVRVISV